MPVDLARPVIERLTGPQQRAARRGRRAPAVFNEVGEEETTQMVASFAERVTAR